MAFRQTSYFEKSFLISNRANFTVAKCHRHGWIGAEILCKMVWSRDSLLSWRPFPCRISIFMPPPLFAHLTETAKRSKQKKNWKAGQAGLGAAVQPVNLECQMSPARINAYSPGNSFSKQHQGAHKGPLVRGPLAGPLPAGSGPATSLFSSSNNCFK